MNTKPPSTRGATSRETNEDKALQLQLESRLRQDDQQCFQSFSPADNSQQRYVAFNKYLIEVSKPPKCGYRHDAASVFEKRVLHVCEFCLELFSTSGHLQRHLARKAKTTQVTARALKPDQAPLTAQELARHLDEMDELDWSDSGSGSGSWPFRPPGNEIYRCDDSKRLSVFEVDGLKAEVYCRSLCLLAQLFIDHKTVHYDVQPFLFYVLTINDRHGCHFAGYFSKQKHDRKRRPNVACICVLPQYQGQGYGRWLIEFSYLLSRIERQPSGPETPLSALGRLSYESYWRSTVLDYLHQLRRTASSTGVHKQFTLDRMSQDTGIRGEDLLATIVSLDLLTKRSGSKKLALNLNSIKIDQHMALKSKEPGGPKADCLCWSPYVCSDDDDDDDDDDQSSFESVPSSPSMHQQLEMLLQKKRKITSSDDDQFISKKFKSR